MLLDISKIDNSLRGNMGSFQLKVNSIIFWRNIKDKQGIWFQNYLESQLNVPFYNISRGPVHKSVHGWGQVGYP